MNTTWILVIFVFSSNASTSQQITGWKTKEDCLVAANAIQSNIELNNWRLVKSICVGQNK